MEFQIITNLTAIQNNLLHYYDLGFIKEKIAYKYFYLKLKDLENLFHFLEKTKEADLKPEIKQTVISTLEKVINAEIDLVIRQVYKKSPQWIDPKVAELLVESLEAIKIK